LGTVGGDGGGSGWLGIAGGVAGGWPPCGPAVSLPRGGIVGGMLLWGLWALFALQSPAPSSHLVLGLAVAAAALLIVVAAAGLRLAPIAAAAWSHAVARRVRVERLPRLLDPDAAGRPRPRAPTSGPAALGLLGLAHAS
jgi:hypothetical protein